MKSLRGQLLCSTVLGTTLVLLASCGLLYGLIAKTLHSGFDDALAARARSLTALAEQGDDGLEFDLVDASLPEFEPSPHAEYYELVRSDGTLFARSPSLGEARLQASAGPIDVPVFVDAVQLPDGRPGRLVSLTFVPRLDFDEQPAGAAAQVTLILGRDVVGLNQTLAHVRNTLIAVCLIAVGLSAAGLVWAVHRGLKSLADLSAQIAGVGERDLSTRISAASTPREMSPVIDRLNDLLARLEAAFQRERRFTGDVAHELRTPLAGLRAQLELALSRDRQPAAYEKVLGDCLSINLQMQRIVENLLHLARADAGQLDLRREPVDLEDTLRESWKPMAEAARARGLTVEWRLDHLGEVETDRDKLRLVLHNLFDNAISYADDRGHISISAGGMNGSVTISVANSGSKLSPGEVERVFERFWRADASYRPAHERHCGLGLPLCRAMMQALGGTIAASANPIGTFTITVQVPAGAAEARSARVNRAARNGPS